MIRFASQACLALVLALSFTVARAQTLNPGPGLTDARLVYANDVERAAAAANQATFEALDPVCNPNGVFDNEAAPITTLLPEGCTTLQFFVYLTTRELVHSANAILGEGAQVANLGVDRTGLGTALRWTAAEELAVQGSMATQFSSNQLANFASRISALRQGAKGFTIASANVPDGVIRSAMNAVFSFDATSREPEFSQWGGFLNASVGNGDKRATGNENAFDFDTTEFALGIDRRFANGLVLGAIATYSEQEIEFDNDAGTVSVVDGDISAEGVGGLAFALWTGEQWFVSTSLGFQSIDYDMRRDIRYPSFNPNLPDSNSTTTSTPQSDIVSLTLDAGYTLNAGPITIEPFVGVDYLDITIDAFDEARSFNSLSGIFDTDGFNLTVAGQDFRSIDTAFGLRLQTTLTPDFGVIMPYLTVEYHLELETDPRVIRARYAGAGNEAFTFEVPTDPFDSDYFTWSAGLSSVVRGARQRRAGSAAAGGVSVFAQYQSVERLDNFDEQIVSAGIRYEF